MDIQIGDEVICRRRVMSRIYHNAVAGPVVEVWPTGDRSRRTCEAFLWQGEAVPV